MIQIVRNVFLDNRSLIQFSGVSGLFIIGTVGISFLVRFFEIYYIPNPTTFGLQISVATLSFIVLFVVYGLYALDCFYKYTLSSLLIVIGMMSNLIERLFFGSVTDYIPFFQENVYINIADIMIWIGIVSLIVISWFLEPYHEKRLRQKVQTET